MEWRGKRRLGEGTPVFEKPWQEVIHVTVNRIPLVWAVTCCYLDVWWAGKCSPGWAATFQQQIHTVCEGSTHVIIDFQAQECERWWFRLSPVWPSTGHCWRTVFVGILRQKFGFSLSLLKCSFSNSAERKLLCWGLRICISTKFSCWFLYFPKVWSLLV